MFLFHHFRNISLDKGDGAEGKKSKFMNVEYTGSGDLNPFTKFDWRQFSLSPFMSQSLGPIQSSNAVNI